MFVGFFRLSDWTLVPNGLRDAIWLPLFLAVLNMRPTAKILILDLVINDGSSLVKLALVLIKRLLEALRYVSELASGLLEAASFFVFLLVCDDCL